MLFISTHTRYTLQSSHHIEQNRPNIKKKKLQPFIFNTHWLCQETSEMYLECLYACVYCSLCTHCWLSKQPAKEL